MDKLSKKLGDEEVNHKFIMLPHGKEKMFPKEDFEVEFEGNKFKAYVFPFENKAMGTKKLWAYKLMFREPMPEIFHFGVNISILVEVPGTYKFSIS